MNSNQWNPEEIGAERSPEPLPPDEPASAEETLRFSSVDPASLRQEPIPAPPPYPYPPQTPPSGFVPASAPKKKRKGLKSLALVLATLAILAVGVFGGFWLKAVTTPSGTPGDPSLPPVTEENDDVGSHPVIPPDDKEPVFTPNEDPEDTMNAKEIYANNVNSIVGITLEGEMYNIFGSISAYASSGTGFILNEQGYILTNYHVIQGDDTVSNPKLTVTLYDSQTYEGAVVGYDEFSDVALIKIEAEGLDPISIGNSDQLVAGESVAIIGHPLGELTYSISKGIVAAVNREIAVENKKLEMFQIDAAVNSGNSGGPAFNENGQVVGIVTSKYASSSIEGLGFCIPINNAVKIANDLINYGFVRGQAGLGVTVKNVYSNNGFYQQNFGAQVQSVNPGSCAEKAGIQKGDIIIGLDGTRITTTVDLNALKANYHMGDTVTLTLYRDGEELEVEVTFDEFIPEQLVQAPSVA